MSCLQCSWRIQPLLVCVALAAALWACKSSKEGDKAAPKETALPEEPMPEATTKRPLDPSFVPSAALAELAGMELVAEAPCSLTIDTLQPALDSIASYQDRLAAASDEASAVQLLTELSAELSSRVPAIAARTESDELRRISAELSASLGDLAESLQLASDALTARDKPASAATMRRIHNGVTNTRSSVEGLIRQCAL